MKRILPCILLLTASTVAATSVAPERAKTPVAAPSSQKQHGGQVVLLKDFNEVKEKVVELKQKLGALTAEKTALETELAKLRSDNENAESSSRNLVAEHDRLSAELAAIRQTSAHALQIEAERNQLREKLMTTERDLEAQKLENQALAEDTRQRWFFIGAVVLAAGLGLGLIAPQLGWRKRSSWDSF
ncbi:MAG: TIGR04211 family SH3 domain-containing protein [Methylococcus sp.]|nr:TIGR04211 family SH3 domain-containing protein [Methylococcus sp.]